jgi:hypothetical protein
VIFHKSRRHTARSEIQDICNGDLRPKIEGF